MSRTTQRLIALMIACWTTSIAALMIADPPEAMTFDVYRALLGFLPGAVASVWLMLLLCKD